jgi:hypothetical protein
MTHIKVTIDDVVEFDGSVTEWTRKRPDMLKDSISADSTPKPWMKTIMLEMSDAIKIRRSVEVDVTTGTDEWSARVRYR